MIIGSELSIYSDNNWHSLYEYIENIINFFIKNSGDSNLNSKIIV